MTQQASPHKKQVRLLEIDVLRGLAVLAVFVTHFRIHFKADLPNWILELPLGLGARGVLLFLVLSGFCIHLRAARSSDLGHSLDFIGFWKRRIVRLYPPYLATLAITFISMTALAYFGSKPLWPPLGYSTEEFMLDLGGHLLMLHIFLPQTALGFWNSSLWSLALEEQLYLLYWFYLKLRRQYGPFKLLSFVIVLSLLYRAFILFNPWYPAQPELATVVGSSVFLLHAPSHLPEWCLGALAVEAYLGRISLPEWCFKWQTIALAFSAAFLCEIYSIYLFKDLCYGLAFFFVLNWCCLRGKSQPLKGLAWNLLAKVGLRSYALYLLHIPTLIVLDGFLYLTYLDFLPLRLATLIAGPFLLMHFFYEWIEKPFILRSQKITVIKTAG